MRVHEIGRAAPAFQALGPIGLTHQSTLPQYHGWWSRSGLVIAWTSSGWTAIDDIHRSAIGACVVPERGMRAPRATGLPGRAA